MSSKNLCDFHSFAKHELNIFVQIFHHFAHAMKANVVQNQLTFFCKARRDYWLVSLQSHRIQMLVLDPLTHLYWQKSWKMIQNIFFIFKKSAISVWNNMWESKWLLFHIFSTCTDDKASKQLLPNFIKLPVLWLLCLLKGIYRKLTKAICTTNLVGCCSTGAFNHRYVCDLNRKVSVVD